MKLIFVSFATIFMLSGCENLINLPDIQGLLAGQDPAMVRQQEQKKQEDARLAYESEKMKREYEDAIKKAKEQAEQADIKFKEHQAHLNKNEVCVEKGRFYAAAAEKRDAGVSPQIALAQLKGFENGNLIPLSFLKKAINSVYFDPDFKNAGGDLLMMQMTSLCIYGKKSPFIFKPLN